MKNVFIFFLVTNKICMCDSMSINKKYFQFSSLLRCHQDSNLTKNFFKKGLKELGIMQVKPVTFILLHNIYYFFTGSI